MVQSIVEVYSRARFVHVKIFDKRIEHEMLFNNTKHGWHPGSGCDSTVFENPLIQCMCSVQHDSRCRDMDAHKEGCVQRAMECAMPPYSR